MMKPNKIISAIAGVVLAVSFAGVSAIGASAAEEEGGTPHYPIKHPKHVHWSFAGPFGHWDIGQLQRGLKVYREVCSACHGMDLVAFRNLETLGYTEDQIKALAAEYEVTDGPDSDGEMFERTAVPSDRFPSPFPNAEAAAAANNGAAPPDFSLLAKARAPERGFPAFVFDIFTLYAENGPDYIYSLLTGYEDAPAGVEVPEGAYYNPYFIAGPALAMAPPLSDGMVTYDDGAPETVDQYSRDISAFMMFAAEPHLVERKSMGFKVLTFLLIFAGLLYFTKKQVWAGLGSVTGSSGSGNVDRAARETALSVAAASAPVGIAAMPEATTATAPKAIRKAPARATVVKPARKKAPARKKGPVRYKKPNGKADDLKMISGVGPKLEKTLNDLGFWHFSQIAKWTKSDVATVDNELGFKGRIVRENWIAQAKALAKGGRDEYVRVFGKEPV